MYNISMEDIDLTNDDSLINLNGKIDLNDFTPYDVIGKSYEFQESIKAKNKILTLYRNQALRMFFDTFILKASSNGLKIFEDMLKINNPSENLEERRRRVLTLWNSQILWTHRTLEDFLTGYIGEDKFNVELNYNEYGLILDIQVYKNLDLIDLSSKLRQIIPANLTIDFRIIFENSIFYNDSVKSFKNRLYTVGKTYKTGTVYKQQYAGTIIKNNINLSNQSSVREQRQYKTKEIRTGGVKR